MIVPSTIFRREKKTFAFWPCFSLKIQNKIYSSFSSSFSEKQNLYYSTDVTRHNTKEPQLKNNNRNQSDKDNLRHSGGRTKSEREKKKQKPFSPLLHHHHQRWAFSTTLAASRAPNNNSKLWPTNSCVGTCSTENLLLLLLLQRHVFLMKVQLFLPLFPLEK